MPLLDALVEFTLIPGFLQQAAIPGVGQGFNAFADLAELVTVVIVVEDRPFRRVGSGSLVLLGNDDHHFSLSFTRMKGAFSSFRP